jgi:uncharacterized protein (TIGR02231 family)
VNCADWEPTYDLHAATEDGRPSTAVTLEYRARIKQSTGEDWRDTTLVLSTSAYDARGKGDPQLKTLLLKERTKLPAMMHRPTMIVQPPGPMPSWVQPAAHVVSQDHARRRSHSSLSERSSVSRSHSRSRSPATVVVQNRRHSLSPTRFDPPETTYSVQRRTATMPDSEEYGFGTPELEALSDSEVEETFEQVETPGVAEKPKTVVSESPLSMTYSVQGKSSIPSDGIAHQVLVASLPFEASVTYVAVPRVETVAYLQVSNGFLITSASLTLERSQCEVKNTSEYRLLPGAVSVFLDDSFVSKTRIQDVNTGDTFNCTLGADPSVRLTLVRTSLVGQVEGGAFAEKFRTTTYKSKTTVRNKHRFALNMITVRDGVPLVPPEEKRTRVVLREPKGLADGKPGEEISVSEKVKVRWAKDEDGKGGEKDGKVEWIASVESGEEVTLELEYEVRGPAETTWYVKAET